MMGKMNSATALSMKMVPMATVMSLSLALMTGAKAAMALPPQMAVPPETRNPVSRLTLEQDSCFPGLDGLFHVHAET